MNPLELRKIIGVGVRYIRKDGGIVLHGPDGEPLLPDDLPRTWRVVFWIPQKPPFQRRGVEVNPNPPPPGEFQHPLEGYTLVHDVRPFELEALRAGAIREEVIDFNYDKRQPFEQLRKDFLPHWEKLTLEALGYLPNEPPKDLSRKFEVLFTPV